MICLPISYIHSLNVVHRDLKPPNILVSSIGSQNIYILTDFGVSIKKGNSYLTTLRSKMTNAYASIEQMSEQESGPHFDMWALGIMAYRMMLGEEPYMCNNEIS